MSATSRYRTRVILIVAAAMTGFNFLLYGYLNEIGEIKMSIPVPKPKVILLWTTVFRKEGTAAWGWGKGVLEEVIDACPFKCRFTLNKSDLSIADALVYHGWKEGNPMYPLPKPSNRKWNQVWVYFMLEPPCRHSKEYDKMADNNDFNWTMTYRRDSDVPALYGDFEKIRSDPELLPVVRTNNRSLVAGMISHCKESSGRDEYVAELNRSVHVDLYGKCGDHAISKESRKRSSRGYDILAKKYKFWLSFENSVAPDYLTEKFFLPLKYGMVPIYLGYPDNLRYAPPKSYIHTKDFKNPKALGKYLMYLDKNPREYLKYFDWRKKYRLKANLPQMAWCKLCIKLHNSLTANQSKSYRSIADWFLRNNTATGVCAQPWKRLKKWKRKS